MRSGGDLVPKESYRRSRAVNTLFLYLHLPDRCAPQCAPLGYGFLRLEVRPVFREYIQGQCQDVNNQGGNDTEMMLF